MKEFFRSQLKKLHLIGIRQVDYLSKEDVETLLDELVKITKKFSYIPEPRQMAEIEKQLVEDLDAKDGLTLRNLWKWMYKISPLYWNATRISEEDLTPQGPIMEGDARQAWLDKWRKELDNVNTNFLQGGKGGGSRLKESLGIEKAQSVGVIKNYDIGEVCPSCKGEGFTIEIGAECCEEFIDSICCGKPKQVQIPQECSHCNGEGKINVVSIPATSEEAARQIYIETFGLPK